MGPCCGRNARPSGRDHNNPPSHRASGGRLASWELYLVGLFVPLYSRLVAPRDALRCENRARILADLRLRGPRRVVALARDLGIDPSNLRAHVRVLRRSGHVRFVREGVCTVVALPGQDVSGALADATRRAGDAVMRVVIDHRGEVLRADMDRLLPDLPQRVRNRAVQQLAREGAIRRDLSEGVETVRLASIPPPVPGGRASGGGAR